MKKLMLLLSGFLMSMSVMFAQPASTSLPMIGDDAPSFTAESTNGTINFPLDLGRKWKILFAHPADFTPVCTTELMELANMQDEFDQLDAKLVVISTDALENHQEWKKSIESLTYKGQTIDKIKFPLVADASREVSTSYGMIHPASHGTKNVRGLYIIDPSNKIRAMLFYPMEVGRNTEEIKRTLIALQTTSAQKVLTPADWKPGDDVVLPYSKADGQTQVSTDPNVYQVSWYLWFKKN